MSKYDRIHSAVKSLAMACGYDTPIAESQTEEFALMLDVAIQSTLDEMEQSHRSGLFLDAFGSLASSLLTAMEVKREHKETECPHVG